jgi:hypothetical protein
MKRLHLLEQGFTNFHDFTGGLFILDERRK